MSSTAKQTSQRGQSSASGGVRGVVNETAESLATGARDCAVECTEHYLTEPAKDLFSLAKGYAKENPDVAAAWAFAVGVVVGWKLKP